MDLNEGMDLPVVDSDEPAFEPAEPTYGFSTVHDRVFVTWYEQRHDGVDDDDYVFVSEPKAIELTPEEAEQFNDLFNAQMDQMQALLQGFVVNRAES